MDPNYFAKNGAKLQKNKCKEITDATLQQSEKINNGAYGTVYKVGANAVKVVPEIEFFLHEIAILSSLDHPNVIKCLEYSFAPNCIIMEYYETTLHDLDSALTSGEIKNVAYDIALGLQYIHGAGIIHADLKPANILIRVNREQKGIVIGAAICDFGISIIADGVLNYQNICTAPYRAPEINFGDSKLCTYNNKIDIWSFGCILFEAITRRPLFANSEHHRQPICALFGVPFGSHKQDMLNLYSLTFGDVKANVIDAAISAFAQESINIGNKMPLKVSKIITKTGLQNAREEVQFWRDLHIIDMIALCITPNVSARYNSTDLVRLIEVCWTSSINQTKHTIRRQPLTAQPKCDIDDMTILTNIDQLLLNYMLENATMTCLNYAQKLYKSITGAHSQGFTSEDIKCGCIFISAVVFMAQFDDILSLMGKFYNQEILLSIVKFILSVGSFSV